MIKNERQEYKKTTTAKQHTGCQVPSHDIRILPNRFKGKG